MRTQKNIRKGISLLVCLSLLSALLLVCSGCGGNKEKDALVGTWETTIDMSDMLNEELQAGLGNDQELMQYFNISDFTMKIVLTFNSDDTYQMAVDKASIDASLDNFLNMFRNGMEQYFEDLIAQEGLDMTVDEVLEASGMGSLDDLIEEAFDRDDLVSSLDDVQSSGTFDVKNGNIHLTDDEGPGIEPYKLDGNKLTLTGEGVTDGDLLELYPMTFTKK